MPKLVLLLAAWSPAILPAADVLVPMNLSAHLSDERVRLESTRLDIGTPRAVLDGDPRSLARTPSINPLRFSVTFPNAVTVHGFEVVTSTDRHRVLIRADSAARPPLVEAEESFESGTARFALTAPATAASFSLELTRLAGDDYVHLFEWRFLEPGSIRSLRLRQIRRVAEAHRGPDVRPAPAALSVPADTLVRLELCGTTTTGVELDVTDRAEWHLEGAPLRPGGKPWWIHVTGSGTGAVTARYGGSMVRCEVRAAARTPPNREPDIDTLFVERLPRLDFDGPNGGWPRPGQTVTWRAHIINWGEISKTVEFLWRLDDRDVSRGTVQIDPLARVTVDLPWTWEQKRHRLEFIADPDNKIPEDTAPCNNAVGFATDALAVGFWVERSIWDYHHENGPRLRLGDHASFADWAQRHMRRWNDMLAEARFTEAPDGVLDRVRLDRLVVVPDNALPLASGLATNTPDRRDKTVDLMWGFPTYALETEWWSVEEALKRIKQGRHENAALYYDLALFHELGHARYLIDMYGFDVHASGAGDEATVQITDDDGVSILGRYVAAEGIIHWRTYSGQMGGDYSRYGIYEVAMLNRVAGRRARGGNYNAPSVIGEFLQDIPERFYLRFVDKATGSPLDGAVIRIYRAAGTGTGWYSKRYDDTPDLTAGAGADGRAAFDRTMFAANGRIVHTYGHANSVVIVRVDYRGQRYFLFQEVTDLNLAYQRGETVETTVTRAVTLRAEGDPIVPLDPHNQD